MVLDKLLQREKRMIERKRDSDILNEIRKPQEDSEIASQKDLPELERIPGLKLAGQALADLLMVYEFLHNFGETLGFGEFKSNQMLNVEYISLNEFIIFRHGLIAVAAESASSADIGRLR